MIRLDADGGYWIATLDRPEKANSLTGDMLAQLADIADRAETGAKVLVLTGTGKVFSAGADLDAARAGLAIAPVWERLSAKLAALPCLTVAALNGTLAGGAFGMALACDIRIAVPEARFFYPVMELGFLPQPGDAQRLAALVGPARAKMILLAGQHVTAEEALAWGLIDGITEREALADRARDLGQAALGADAAHVAGIKRLIEGS